ncbi:hypothetical protein ACEPAF_3137 [Sanghuangporus sanghuang]|uniref:YL1-domain-containing protein n=1 Tax=Sanghuangporus baumii TaxID=108892 RepID=A0A9Q5I045_SANBA|nr:YL1-domain-containing protein [Sanghuangporus baumii]
MADEDSLVLRRSRRSTAGNRMEAALAEMAALHPEQEMEVDDDKDFLAPADEGEVFDSDFQSTDEEADQEDEFAAEKELAAEEKQARKSSRRQSLRTTEARSVAIQPSSKTSAIVLPLQRRRKWRKVDAGQLRDSGTRISLRERGKAVVKRKSQRKSTVLSSQILHLRLKDAEERRAAVPKRSKEASVSYSQAELLARALDNEEGNIVSHRNYLEEEEEKRKRARVVKRKLTGPVLSWVSRIEDETVQPEPATSDLVPPYGSAPLPSSYFASSATLQALSQPQARLQTTKVERVVKNYLTHKADEGMPRPGWSESMKAIFGDHADWNEVRVYVGKHRPLSRPIRKCSVTGRMAIYLDPRSGVPFADVDAYRVLSRLVTHEYIWNDGLRCYTADEKAVQLEPELDDPTDGGQQD